MGKQNNYTLLFKPYPSYISKEQMRLICHISKQKARYLLKSGLVPCKDNGKRTRNYRIAIADVIAYLKDRDKNPAKYHFPKKLNDGQYKPEYIARMREYYIDKYREYPDVVKVCDLVDMLGYTQQTIIRWVSEKQITAFYRKRTYFIPKTCLVDYLVSLPCLSIHHKSERHINDIKEFECLYTAGNED